MAKIFITHTEEIEYSEMTEREKQIHDAVKEQSISWYDMVSTWIVFFLFGAVVQLLTNFLHI